MTEKAKELANDMSKAATIEAQQQSQRAVLALINYTPGFDTYKTELPGGYGYESRDIYLDKKVPENQRGLRNGLASEILHEKMVDMQYNRSK